jgi:hypothetical protein
MNLSPTNVFKKSLFLAAMLFSCPLFAQETENTSQPVIPDFEVLRTDTRSVLKEEPAPLPGMIPVRKVITETVEVVADPQLPIQKPEPEKPVRILSEEERAALRARHRAVIPVMLSATVYDHKRTMLRWFPNGVKGGEMIAWSAVDFNVFGGMHRFSYQGREYSLMLIGIGNEDTERSRLRAQRIGRPYVPVVHPELPLTGTPEFVVTKGDAADVMALAPIVGLHELYRREKDKLHAQYEARKKAQKEYEAWVRAHPPEPKDVLIRVWKTETPSLDGASPLIPVTPLLETPVTSDQ